MLLIFQFKILLFYKLALKMQVQSTKMCHVLTILTDNLSFTGLVVAVWASPLVAAIAIHVSFNDRRKQ